MPGFVSCPGTDPLWGGIGGDTAAILLGLKLYNSFPFLHRYVTLMGGSHHLISQAGWNRCILFIYLSSDSTSPGCLAVDWLPVMHAWYVSFMKVLFASSACGP